MKDPRHQSYIRYKSYILLYIRILAAVFHIESMRRMTEDFNRKICIENLRYMMRLKTLEEIPHWSTINDYLETLDSKALELVVPQLVSRLIRSRAFEGSRIRNRYWQIIVDGSELYNANKRHCPHCLTREHRDAQGKVVWTEYYHNVLEAKLVLNGTIVVSIATEFIENEAPNTTKQDCERKAFYRLAEKLKRYFPKLPICLCADSLYACGPVFDLCRRNQWRYLIRFKDGSIRSVAEEFRVLKTLEPDQAISRTRDGVTETYRYVTGIPYQAHSVNVVEYSRTDLKYPFVFLTDLPVSKRNCQSLVCDGRNRWRIENEGFNAQKNHGYGLTHRFSEDYTAMKNHYFLIQIGHMIAQIYANATKIWRIIKTPDFMIFYLLKLSFQTVMLSKLDIYSHMLRRRYRFVCPYYTT